MDCAVIITFIFLSASLILIANRNSSYSHIRHTISELGERGAINEKRVLFGIFLPVGIAMALIGFAVRSNEPAAILAGSLSIGYVGAAFFPIDAGAPVKGSWRNGMHSLFGAIQYVGSIASFEQFGRDYGLPYTAVKYVIFAFIISLYIPYIREIRGLIQRAVELGLFIGLVFMIQSSGA